MTKKLFRATNGATGKTDYGNASHFDVQKIAIDSLAALTEVLADLAWRTDCFVIRGLPTGSHYNLRRRIHGQDAAFVADPAGHHWFMVDFDEVRMPMFLEPDDDPELLLRFLTRFLPAAFHDASFYWQWSCGQGIDRWRTLRAHLWFWSKDKHTDAELERWAQWVNGEAGWKILDPVVMRTVQPNYVSAPVIGDGIIDPVHGDRQGIYVGYTDEVTLHIPTQKWDDHVREVERQEYQELVEHGLRQSYSSLDQFPNDEKYLEYLCRIGDDKDGFYEPMTKAIWHWARSNPSEKDDAFKTVLRQVVREARCAKQRNLDTYLSDYRLDASLRGAREKRADYQPKPKSTFAVLQMALRRASFTRKALLNR
jgi:hypothetical protein